MLRSTHTGSAHRTGDSARVGVPSAVDTWASPLGGCGRYSALTAANGRRKCSLKANGRGRCPPSQPQRHDLVCVGVSPLGTTATPDGVIASQISTARKVATTFRRVGDLSKTGFWPGFFLPTSNATPAAPTPPSVVRSTSADGACACTYRFISTRGGCSASGTVVV